MPDTDTSRQTRRTILPRHKQAPQLAPCQGRRDCVKGHVTSKIQPRSQILRKRGPQKLMKTHVRPLLPATDPVAKNIGPITWPQRACRYHQKQDIPEHLRGRTLWAPCSRLVKTPVLRTSGLIGRYCCKHTNEDMSLDERVHARFFLKGVTIPAKECFIATFEAVIQSAFVLTANNRSILVLLSVPLASAAQIFGRLKAVL